MRQWVLKWALLASAMDTPPSVFLAVVKYGHQPLPVLSLNVVSLQNHLNKKTNQHFPIIKPRFFLHVSLQPHPKKGLTRRGAAYPGAGRGLRALLRESLPAAQRGLGAAAGGADDLLGASAGAGAQGSVHFWAGRMLDFWGTQFREAPFVCFEEREADGLLDSNSYFESKPAKHTCNDSQWRGGNHLKSAAKKQVSFHPHGHWESGK